MISCDSRLDVDSEDLPPCKKLKLDSSPSPKEKRLSHGGGVYPVKVVTAQGQCVFDGNGKRYLDVQSGTVGHCHPKVVEAGAKQMAVLNTNSRFLNDKIITYAKRLCATFPKPLSCCFFTNSGSEANELALQIAEAVTGNSQILTLNGAKHGHSMTLRRLNLVHNPDKTSCVVPLPDVYRGQYQDRLSAGELYATEMRKLIKKLGNEVAAFIHESLPCWAGQILFPDGYLEAAYSHVREAGGVCIADEQQSGFGRVGKHLWAFEMQGVCPDIVTLGKQMSNGHPVGVVITSKDIAEKFAASGIEYFNTFGGNPVSMAIAEAVLLVIDEEDLQSHAEEVGSYLLQGLEGLMERHSCIGDVRGVGLFLGVEFVRDRESKEPDKEMAECIMKQLVEDHQIMASVNGLCGNVLQLKPPLCISKDDCRLVVHALDCVLGKIDV